MAWETYGWGNSGLAVDIIPLLPSNVVLADKPTNLVSGKACSNTMGCYLLTHITNYSKTCVKRPLLKIQKIGFQDQLMLVKSIAKCSKGGILQYFRPSLVIEIFVLSIFDWPFYTGFLICIAHPPVKVVRWTNVLCTWLHIFTVVMSCVSHERRDLNLCCFFFLLRYYTGRDVSSCSYERYAQASCWQSV